MTGPTRQDADKTARKRRGETKVEIPSLTGIRGVAALWVMATHLDPMLGKADFPGRSIMNNGWSAVDLFFVLSGFILAHAHGARLANPTARDVARYATSRIRRVMPPNLIVLAAIATLLALDQPYREWRGTPAFPASSLANLALLLPAWIQPAYDLNGPVWSLSAEMAGYLTLPALVWLFARARLRTAIATAATCLVAFAAIRAGMHASGTHPTTGWGALVRVAPCFIAGVALQRVRTGMERPTPRIAAGASMAAAVAIIAAASTWRLVDVLPALYAMLILTLSYEAGPVAALLRSRPAMAMGRISFPFYLVHMTCVSYLRYLIERHSMSLTWTTAAVVLGASIAIAAALHRLLERTTARPRRGATTATEEASTRLAAT